MSASPRNKQSPRHSAGLIDIKFLKPVVDAASTSWCSCILLRTQPKLFVEIARRAEASKNA